MNESLIFLITGGVLAISIVVALLAANANVPALFAFLVLGMVLGSEGIGHIQFSDVGLAQTVGTIGLIAILFEGGLSTSLRRMREAVLPSLLLSTIGVFVTAILVGVAAHYLFGLAWAFALLLGAVVSSTDSAAVFATLRFTSIRRHLARILEAESALNDPMAISLTIGFITWVSSPSFKVASLGLLLLQQLGIGLVVGLVLGWLAMRIFERLPQSIGAFAPVASVATALLSFGIASSIGGSGFLSVYIVGLAIGSTPSRYRGPLTMFHEGLAFLAQVAMFMIMGLFVVPHKLWEVALPSILLALLLVLVIRPLSVWISLPVGKMNNREKTLLGWAGLRGAVPIVLAMYVLSSHVPHGDVIFNAVFFVVLASTLIQGTTLNWVAKRLDVIDHLPTLKKEADAIERIFFHVAPQHAIAGAHIHEVGLPPRAKIIEIKRRSKNKKVISDTVLKAGDRLCIEAPFSIHPEVEDVFMRWRRRV